MEKDLYIKLIYQQLKGKISDEEQEQLTNWEQASEENKDTADGIRKAWDNSAEYELPFELDLDQDFKQLQSKIQRQASPEKENTVSLKPRPSYWWKIAAALLFLLIAGFLLRNYLQQEAEWITHTTGESPHELVLPEGTKILVNKVTTISYPKVFASHERVVKLEGEAFFDVSKDPKRTFYVLTNDLEVNVIGTRFNVRDFEKNGAGQVSVEEGKVRVLDKKAKQSTVLVAQESAILSDDILIKKKDTNLNALAWKRKRLNFSGTALSEVMQVLMNKYTLTLTLDNPFLDECPFTGSFKTETKIQLILEGLASAYKAELQKVSDKEYLLIGGICK